MNYIMKYEKARSMINYRFYLEQSRIKKELETCLQPIHSMFKKNKISQELVLNNYYTLYLNSAIQMIQARLEVEKDVRQRTGIGINDSEIEQINSIILFTIKIQEQALTKKIKDLKITVQENGDISFENLRGKVPEIMNLFCQELDFNGVKPIAEPPLNQNNVNQLFFNIEHNLKSTVDKSLASTLYNLTQAVKSNELHSETLTESLEIIEGLTEQAKLQPHERRRGVINGCLHRLKMINEGGEPTDLAVHIIQMVVTVAIAFDCALDLTYLL